MGKTLFAGEYSSRNVGDGIIKLAIETLCRDHGVDAEFRDFFGNAVPARPARSDASATAAAAPGIALHAGSAQRMGPVKRRLLASATVNYAIAILFYLTRYKRIAARYDTAKYRQVVIGGGNLLMDNFLNFPFLILRVVKECERNKVPLKLFSVGAGRKLSLPARKIIGRIVQSDAVVSIMCRDEHSCALVRDAAHPRHSHKVKSSFDSGLYLQRDDSLTAAGSTIGLGVIAPSVLGTLAPDHPMANPDFAVAWWDGIVGSLHQHMPAQDIELISNGSTPDNDFAHMLWNALSPRYPGLSVCTDIRKPEDLLQRIAGYRALAAFRMHATVTAMALQVPVMGFEWDPKVLQMFSYCGKRDACISIAEFNQYSADDITDSLLSQTPASLLDIRSGLRADFRTTVGADE
ncbi:MAG TPA: polysaccharide pyruvyl transferase family protein [Burkholderiaceae bacterium]|nr:polysaccharide pyruvyl transferase family protein [Burkholderiaceae bacterium]